MTDRKHLVFIVGHNSEARGAVNVHGETEWSWNGRIGGWMQDYAREEYPGLTVSVVMRLPGPSNREEIRQAYARADELGADVVIEGHFNSFHDESAKGCEMIHSGSTRGADLAGRALICMLEAFPDLHRRGAKVATSHAGGLTNVKAGKAPAVIAEPFFGSNPSDFAMFSTPDAEKRLARAYVDAAVDALRSWHFEWSPTAEPEPTPPEAPKRQGFWAALAAFFGVKT